MGWPGGKRWIGEGARVPDVGGARRKQAGICGDVTWMTMVDSEAGGDVDGANVVRGWTRP